MAKANDMKIKCAICLGGFKKPKFLPCHHTFCLKCLIEFVEANDNPRSIECPICRETALVPKGGVECLTTNYYCDVSAEDHVTCDTCSKLATHRCFECEQDFCDQCTSVHMRMTASKDHKLKNFSHLDEDDISKIKARFFCEKHPKDEVKFICKTDNEFICVVCMFTEHKDHETMDITIEAKRKRDEIRREITTSERNMRKSGVFVSKIETNAKDLQEKYKRRIELVKRRKNKIVSEVNQYYEDFEQRIRRQFQKNQDICRGISDNQKRVTELYQRTIKNVNDNLSEETDVGFLKNFDTLSENLKKIVVADLPELTDTDIETNLEECTTWLDMLERSNNRRRNQTFEREHGIRPVSRSTQNSMRLQFIGKEPNVDQTRSSWQPSQKMGSPISNTD